MSFLLRRKKHLCDNMGEWGTCSICDGRIHDSACTSKKRPQIDCCPARHLMLYNQGQTVGISDQSQLMLTDELVRGLK